MTQKHTLLSLLVFVACSSKGPNLSSKDVAIVNDRSITIEQFVNQIETIKDAPGVSIQSPDGRANILKDLVKEELVFQDAIKDGFHLNNADLKHELVKLYLQSKFGKHLPTVTDQQIKQAYEESKNVLDQVRASHVLIKTKPEDDQAKRQAAKTKIEKIRSDIVKGKISFAEAAATMSEDDSKEVGGDLGYFTRNQMVPQFSEAAFAIKAIGDISPVIQTDFGYHIITLTGDSRGLELNRDRIRYKLYQDVMQPKIDAYFDKLKGEARVQLTTQDLMAIPIPNS